jgi:Putative transcription activator
MTFVEEMIDAVEDLWDSFLEHPFIVEMSQGTLPENKMMHYLIEDSLFLKEYVRVCAIGIFKSENTEQMDYFTTTINGILKGEYALRDSYLLKFGIKEADLVHMTSSKENQAYANYLMQTALEGDLPEIFAALFPCILSYYHIGKQLVQQDPECLNRKYGEVISEYISDIANEACLISIKHINKLCNNLDLQQKKKLVTICRESSLYERDFWNMAYDI